MDPRVLPQVKQRTGMIMRRGRAVPGRAVPDAKKGAAEIRTRVPGFKVQAQAHVSAKPSLRPFYVYDIIKLCIGYTPCIRDTFFYQDKALWNK